MPTHIEHSERRELNAVLALLDAMDSGLDATMALQDAINQGVGAIEFPKGTYKIEGTLRVPEDTLVFLSGCMLERIGDSIEPLIHLAGTSARVIGGQLFSQKNHPKGLVVVGHRDPTDLGNVLRCGMRDVRMRGVQAQGNVGIRLASNQYALGVMHASYWHVFENCEIRGADEGIVVNEKCNSNHFMNMQFWDMITSAFTLKAAYDTKIFGGFVHTSTNGVVGVRLLNNTHGTPNFHHTTCTRVVGLGFEPGGADSKAVFIDTECSENRLEIMNNAKGENVILNKNNTVLCTFGRQFYSAANDIEHYGREWGESDVRSKGHATLGGGANVWIGSVEVKPTRVAMVEIRARASNPTTDNPTCIRQLWAVRNTNGAIAWSPLESSGVGTAIKVTVASPGTDRARFILEAITPSAGTWTVSWEIKIEGIFQPVVDWARAPTP